MHGKHIESLFLDSKNNIWIGTESNGVYIMDVNDNLKYKQLKHEINNNSLLGNNVKCIYEANESTMWLGLFTAGINIIQDLDYTKFTSYANIQTEDETRNNAPLSLLEKDQKILVGTDGLALCQLRDSSKENIIRNEDSLTCFDVIKSMCYTSNNELWLGSYRNGLCILKNDSQRTHIKAKPQLSDTTLQNGNVWVIKESTHHDIWLGMLNGGVSIYNQQTEKFKHYDLKAFSATKTHVSVVSIYETQEGNMWLGTLDDGIIVYNRTTEKFTQYRTKLIRKIVDITESSDGSVWLASNGGGLLQVINLERDELNVYSTENGLPTNNVVSILEDDRNNLWIGTEQGLVLFRRKHKTFHTYNQADGLISSIFIYGSKLKTNAGHMYFGTIKGIVGFHPDNIHIDIKEPNIVITQFKAYNKKDAKEHLLPKSITYTDTVRLDYHVKLFSIEFAALNFDAPNKCQYAYKLEGFNQEWTYVSSDQRLATYMNLDAGTYQFWVKASNSDQVWNTRGRQLTIIISPPWWQLWWVKFTGGLSFLLLSIALIYWKINAVHQKNKVLEEKIAQRTLELQASNSSLSEKNDQVIKANELLEDKNTELELKTKRILEQQHEIQQQKENLELLHDTKDKIFSIVAHDLRNPVGALSALTNSLRKQNENTPYDEETINHLIISSQSISNVIDNLIAWIGPQTGLLKAKAKSLSIRETIEASALLHVSQMKNKKIELIQEIDRQHFAIADPHMLNTIVRNLLNNAIKFSPNENKIKVSSQFEQQNGRVFISFTNYGDIIPHEKIDLLLSEGPVESTKDTNNELGMGYGLSLCKDFIQKNKGTLSITSSIENGTSFIVDLPGEVQKISHHPHDQAILETDQSTSHLISEDFKGKKIVLADDNEQVRAALKSILSPYFEVTEAADGDKAEEITENNLPDLVISDIQMPGKNGFKVCQNLKQKKSTSHIPIILITGENSQDYEFEGILSGADRYLRKPFDAKILLSTINNLFLSQHKMKIRFSNNPDTWTSEIEASSLDSDLLLKATNFIISNIDNTELNGDMLAQELGISKSILYTKLKNLTGQTVNEFIRVIRLKKSTEFLINGSLNIMQISLEVGFNSSSYYSRSFSEYFGMTPKDYILQHKKSNSDNNVKL